MKSTRILAATLCAFALAQAPPRASVVFSHRLPKLDGAKLTAQIVEVNYGPGESSAPHTHPCPVVGYVLEGAVKMKINDAPEAIYRAGQTFYEDPNARHMVSANASTKDRARFLAYLLCDHEGPVSKPLAH